MTISGIALQHLRSYSQYHLPFREPTTLIVGPNASGKTTIIEAIWMLATGESFRAGKIDEVIQFGAEIGRVKGKIFEQSEAADAAVELELTLTKGLVQGKKTAKRLYAVNGVRRQKRLFIHRFSCVVFRPEDMRLIEGSPSRRRAFLDDPLCQMSKEYVHSLRTYEQTLIRRNRLLQDIRDGKQRSTTLQFWNASLLKHGEVVQHHRQAFLHYLSNTAFPLQFSVEYVPSRISQERMEEYQSRELAAGHTLIGPHKDDFVVYLSKIVTTSNKVEKQQFKQIAVHEYGSRGEQRLGVLWLKFGELSYIAKQQQNRPLLLLDDILSELDSDSQSLALQTSKQYQTIITTTDPSLEELVRQYADGLQIERFENI